MTLLYVCVRPQKDAADAEYASFRHATQLDEQQLAQHDLVRDPLPADAFERYSGFLVGGSPFNVTDPDKTDAQRRLEGDLERIAAHVADGDHASALFTCFGIGVVTRMLGGEVSQNFHEQAGPATIELTDDGARDPLFAGIPREFAALASHKEGAGAVPPGAVLLATNPACPVQGYRVGERLYATQFHPEPTPLAFTERMAIYRDAGYFPAEDYDDIVALVLATPVTEPERMLRAFVERFGARVTRPAR